MEVTRGALQRIFASEPNFQPVLQITSVKEFPSHAGSGPPRYKCMVSDHVQTGATAMLASQLGHLATSGELSDGCLFHLTEFMINDVGNSKIIVILAGQIVGSGGNQPNQPLPPSPYGGQQQQQPPQQQLPPQQYGGPPPGVYGAPPQQPQQQPSPFGGSSAYEQPQHNPYNNAGSSSSSSSSNAYQPPAAAAAAVAAPGPYSAQTNSRPVVRDEAVGAITPIAALNPYGSKWTIKARVTSKSDIRRWSNARGEGTLFSIDLLDADNGEIRATFFKEACDKWFSQIEEQRVYTFSNGKLKVVTNKAFTSIKNNYEVTFDMHSEIRPCMEDSAIKSVNYSFTKLDQIESVEVNHTVDILAVISSASELNTVVQKSSGKELKKRDLVVYDDTGVEVRLTVWGDKAENEGYDPGFVLVVKGAKVGDFQGRSLSLTSNSSLVINPQLPEAEAMYHQCAAAKQAGAPMRSLTTAGGERGMEPLAGRHTLSLIRGEDSALGRSDKADFITVKATMSFIKNDDPARLWYTACPTPQCNKKVTESGLGWNCEKCRVQHANCTRRYIMSATMMDHTGQSWVSFFNETAEKVLGVSADALYELSLNDQAAFDNAFKEALFKTFVVKLKVKEESYENNSRLKTSVVGIVDVDYVSESEQMYKELQKYATMHGQAHTR